VAFFERVSTLIQAWQLPLLGNRADEVPPPWLVDRMTSGSLTINSLGGFNHTSSSGFLNCAAGDYVVLTEDDEIEFCKATEFTHRFKLLEESLAA